MVLIYNPILSFHQQKLIKELPSRVPIEDINAANAHVEEITASDELIEDNSNVFNNTASKQTTLDATTQHTGTITTTSDPAIPPDPRSSCSSTHKDIDPPQKEDMVKSRGEIAFFKLLHAEMKKADHFFVKAQEEIAIREERVRDGLDIIQRSMSVMVENKWSCAAKSLFRLYKDLLLLETFAIMSYCSFSKILKKHDKVTGNATRSAFMAKVVNHASFTMYPSLLAMIGRCEGLYDQVSKKLILEGKENLCEAEREFISTIFQLKGQYLDTAEKEGADVAERKESQIKRHHLSTMVSQLSSSQLNSISHLTSSLRDLVEENEAKSQEEMKSAYPSDDNEECVAKKDGRTGRIDHHTMDSKKRSREPNGMSPPPRKMLKKS